MHPILIVQHTTDPDTGWLGTAITEAGHVEQIVQPSRGEALPSMGGVCAVVVLGGSEGAYEEDRYPYLTEEKRYLREADQAGLPVLGICLGAQLLADALGGRSYRAPSSEVGYPEIHLTRAGRRDPVLRQLKGPVFVWHHDTFELPPNAVLLAKTAQYPQAYRRGRSLGMQFHPETSPEMVGRWLLQSRRSELESDGIDPDRLLSEVSRNLVPARRVSQGLLTAWLHEIKAHSQVAGQHRHSCS